MVRQRYGWKIAGLIFKGICVFFVAGVFALLFWRIIDSKIDPREIRNITPNEILCDAYEQADGKLEIFTQSQEPFTRAKENYGYFHIDDALFITEADQLQFTLRYNNSTIEHLVVDHSLNMLPSRDEDLYDYAYPPSNQGLRAYIFYQQAMPNVPVYLLPKGDKHPTQPSHNL